MRSTYSANETHLVTMPQGPQLVRWGSVFSGAIISIALFTLLSGLWLALAFSSKVSFFYSNLSWWVAGTAIFCMLVAGFIAGVTSGARGAAAGTMGGVTTWGLMVISVAAVVLPTFAVGHVPNTVTVSTHVYNINYLTYWTAFWSLLIGLGAASLGGILGGAVQRGVDGPYLDLQRAEGQMATPSHLATTGSPGMATTPTVVGDTGPTVAGEPVVYERQH